MNGRAGMKSLMGILVLCGLAAGGWAADDSSRLTLKTDKVIVFKDGYPAFAIRTALTGPLLP